METTELREWLRYIEQLHSKPIDLGLTRVLKVAQRLNVITFTRPVIMIAGTNGKGSCAHCIESIYLAAGFRVGTYTSPHLHTFNERIRLNGQPASDALILAAMQRVEQERAEESLSYFEFTTLVALLLFQQTALDVIVLEVGLGGRLDAVNIVDADVALITGIDLDHMDWLGEDREAIGWEKAGIFRAQRPVVCGDQEPPVSLLNRAKELSAPLYQINKDFHSHAESASWSWSSSQQQYTQLPVPAIKQENAAISIMAIELLQDRLPVNNQAIKHALSHVRVAGRFEYWEQPIPCLFDVAHNPQAGRWLAEQLKNFPCKGKRIAIVGMYADKDIEQTLMPVAPYVDRWHAATLSVHRGANALQISEALAARHINNCYNFASVAAAMEEAALAEADFIPQRGDQLLVFGSFVPVVEAQTYLMQKAGKQPTLTLDRAFRS